MKMCVFVNCDPTSVSQDSGWSEERFHRIDSPNIRFSKKICIFNPNYLKLQVQYSQAWYQWKGTLIKNQNLSLCFWFISFTMLPLNIWSFLWTWNWPCWSDELRCFFLKLIPPLVIFNKEMFQRSNIFWLGAILINIYKSDEITYKMHYKCT